MQAARGASPTACDSSCAAAPPSRSRTRQASAWWRTAKLAGSVTSSPKPPSNSYSPAMLRAAAARLGAAATRRSTMGAQAAGSGPAPASASAAPFTAAAASAAARASAAAAGAASPQATRLLGSLRVDAVVTSCSVQAGDQGAPLPLGADCSTPRHRGQTPDAGATAPAAAPAACGSSVRCRLLSGGAAAASSPSAVAAAAAELPAAGCSAATTPAAVAGRLAQV